LQPVPEKSEKPRHRFDPWFLFCKIIYLKNDTIPKFLKKVYLCKTLPTDQIEMQVMLKSKTRLVICALVAVAFVSLYAMVKCVISKVIRNIPSIRVSFALRALLGL
jgi:hypothetical protein